jgi:hypothetical protein
MPSRSLVGAVVSMWTNAKTIVVAQIVLAGIFIHHFGQRWELAQFDVSQLQ